MKNSIVKTLLLTTYSLFIASVVIISNPLFADASGSLRTPARDLKICLDPGHGGEAKGAEYEQGGEMILEKDLNLIIGNTLADDLKAYKRVQVFTTRTSDIDIGSEERIAVATQNDADIFISLHNNAKDDLSSDGSMVLCPVSHYQAPGAKTPDNYSAMTRLGEITLRHLTSLGLGISNDFEGFNENGIVRRPHSPEGLASDTWYYEDESIADYYFHLRLTTEVGIPAMVIEHAYVSSTEDYMTYLNTPEKLQTLAHADAAAIAEYYHLEK